MTTQPQANGALAQPKGEVVQMYPNNQLRKQERSFEDTRSAFAVIKDEFFSK